MAPLVCILLAAISQCLAVAPEVKSPAGRFRGRIQISFSGDNFTSYRGIPYSLPPTGDRRFGLPVPQPPIEGVYDAGYFRSQCLQNLRGIKLGMEDCLYLNVFTPVDAQKATGNSLKKVLVFFHLGGLTVGESNIYVPGDLVARGDIIVVTFNFRLGWFGLLRGNSSSLPGNVVFWDQVLALEWVKDNIKSFGGDPNDVTLSGASSGSTSASYLSFSPVAKDLFTKAIYFDNVGPVSQGAPRTSNDLLEIAAEKFGCSVKNLAGNEDEVVDCLKQVSPEDFVQDFEFPNILEGISSGDDLFPRTWSVAIKDVNFLKEVGFFNRDYLIINTKDVGQLLADSVFSKLDLSTFELSIEGLSKWLPLPSNTLKSILLEYQKLFPGRVEAVYAILTDYVYINRSILFLDAFNSCSQNGQAYLMSFDHVNKYIPGGYVLQGLEFPYLFDQTPKTIIDNYYFFELAGDFDEDDEKVKKIQIDLVVDFVKTGNPGITLAKTTNVVWKEYDPDKRNYLSLSLKPVVRDDINGKRMRILEKFVPNILA